MLEKNSVIGILGGGQLARMLCVAASKLGFQTHIYEPDASAPGSQVANVTTTASYEDQEALAAFAKSVDVITYEFENIPAATLDYLERYNSIYPNRKALEVSQDRLVEKEFLQSLGLQVAPYAAFSSRDEFLHAVQHIGVPSILKTRRFGYDGKGQARVLKAEQADAAFDDMKGAPSVCEGFVDFVSEISVIAARGQTGEIACFDPGENIHRDGILHTTSIPAKISASQRMDAVLMASKILNALGYVGVLGVEFFVTKAGLVINEIAPRVHNSGHWTQNGCIIDQFEQHIRAVVGYPLGNGERHSNVEMTNLIGTDINDVMQYANDTQVAIHLYGKAHVRAGRKMGHINRVLGPAYTK